MSLEPADWSIVVAARWNRAILTPAGIRDKVFKISDEDKPLEVQIPIDLLAPPKVMIDGTSVVANWDKLSIRPVRPTFDDLCEARKLAVNAVEALPETPWGAVGYNILFQADQDSQDSVIRVLDSCLDANLGDEQLKIAGRELSRALDWKGGEINLQLSETVAFNGVKLNIQKRTSEKSEILQWLQIPKCDLEALTRQILVNCLKFEDDYAWVNKKEVPNGK